MSGYLRRLVSSGTDGQSDSGMRPIVRSRSPIADMDQRIGLVGFEALAGGSVTPALPEGEAPADGETRGAALPDITVGVGVVQRKVAGGVPVAASASGHPPPFPTVPVKTTGAMEVSAVVSPNRPGMTTNQRTVETVPEPALAPSVHTAEAVPQSFLGSDMPSPANADLAGLKFTPRVTTAENNLGPPMSDLRPAPEPSLSLHRRVFRGLDALVSAMELDGDQALFPHDPDPGPSSLQALSGEPISLEPSTRMPMPRQAEPSPVDDFATAAKPEAGPRVVIGQINVEVVEPPLVAQAPRVPAQPSPVTAASVSKIGPLRPALRSNLLFSLRQR